MSPTTLSRIALRLAGAIVAATIGLGAAIVLVALVSPRIVAAAATVIAPIYIVLVIAVAMRIAWRPMVAAHPPREPAPDAVRQRFQSFGIGIVNLGFAVHVAADESHLHLELIAPLRLLGGTSTSIPWTALEPVGTDPVRPRSARLHPGGYAMAAPRWVRDLIATDDR